MSSAAPGNNAVSQNAIVPAASQNAAVAAPKNAAPAAPQNGNIVANADPRMKMYAHAEMPTLECFPGADPSQIVSTEEALFGYDNFGVKYTAAGCASCQNGKKK